MYTHYLEYLEDRTNKNLKKLYGNSDWNEYIEPAIIMSFSNIEPDLVVKFSSPKDRCGVIIKPNSYKGLKICFFETDYSPIKFINIPEIVRVIPLIKQSYPFIPTNVKSYKYIYEDWISLNTKHSEMWL